MRVRRRLPIVLTCAAAITLQLWGCADGTALPAPTSVPVSTPSAGPSEEPESEPDDHEDSSPIDLAGFITIPGSLGGYEYVGHLYYSSDQLQLVEEPGATWNGALIAYAPMDGTWNGRLLSAPVRIEVYPVDGEWLAPNTPYSCQKVEAGFVNRIECKGASEQDMWTVFVAMGTLVDTEDELLAIVTRDLPLE
jgi:hypothetical protein